MRARAVWTQVRTKAGLAVIGGALLLTGVGVGTAAATGAIGTQPASDETVVTTPAADPTTSEPTTTPAPAPVVQTSAPTTAATVAAVTSAQQPAADVPADPAPETTTAPVDTAQHYAPGSAGGSFAPGSMPPLPGEPGYTDPAQPTQ